MSDVYNFDPVEGNLTCGSINSIGGTVTLGDVTASVTCPVSNLTITDTVTINTNKDTLTEYVTVNVTEPTDGSIILNERV